MRSTSPLRLAGPFENVSPGPNPSTLQRVRLFPPHHHTATHELSVDAGVTVGPTIMGQMRSSLSSTPDTRPPSSSAASPSKRVDPDAPSFASPLHSDYFDTRSGCMTPQSCQHQIRYGRVQRDFRYVRRERQRSSCDLRRSTQQREP